METTQSPIAPAPPGAPVPDKKTESRLATFVDDTPENKSVLMDYMKELQSLPAIIKVISNTEDLDAQKKERERRIKNHPAWVLVIYNPSLHTQTIFKNVQTSIVHCLNTLKGYAQRRRDITGKGWQDDYIAQPTQLIAGLIMTTLINIGHTVKDIEDNIRYLEILVRYINFLRTKPLIIKGEDDGLSLCLAQLVGDITRAISAFSGQLAESKLPDTVTKMVTHTENIMHNFNFFILRMMAIKEPPSDFFNEEREVLKKYELADSIADFMDKNPGEERFVNFLDNDENFIAIKIFLGLHFANKRTQIQHQVGFGVQSTSVSRTPQTAIEERKTSQTVLPYSHKSSNLLSTSLSTLASEGAESESKLLELQEQVARLTEEYKEEINSYLPKTTPFPQEKKTPQAITAYRNFLRFFQKCLVIIAMFKNFDLHVKQARKEVGVLGAAGAPLYLHNKLQNVFWLCLQFGRSVNGLISEYSQVDSGLCSHAMPQKSVRTSLAAAAILGADIQIEVTEYSKNCIQALQVIKPQYVADLMGKTIADAFSSSADLSFYGLRGNFVSSSFFTGTMHALNTARNMLAEQQQAQRRVPTARDMYNRGRKLFLGEGSSSSTLPPLGGGERKIKEHKYISNEEQPHNSSLDPSSSRGISRLAEQKEIEQETVDISFQDFLLSNLPDGLIPKDIYDFLESFDFSLGVLVIEIKQKLYRLDAQLAGFFRGGILGSKNPNQNVMLSGSAPSNFISGGKSTVELYQPGSGSLSVEMDNEVLEQTFGFDAYGGSTYLSLYSAENNSRSPQSSSSIPMFSSSSSSSSSSSGLQLLSSSSSSSSSSSFSSSSAYKRK